MYKNDTAQHVLILFLLSPLTHNHVVLDKLTQKSAPAGVMMAESKSLYVAALDHLFALCQ